MGGISGGKLQLRSIVKFMYDKSQMVKIGVFEDVVQKLLCDEVFIRVKGVWW